MSFFLKYFFLFSSIWLDESTCNGAVPHPYAPLIGTYGIASDVKLWACEDSKSETREKEEKVGERTAGNSLRYRTCAMNKFIEDEMSYQGRGKDMEYKQYRSKYCDMDRLHSHLRISKVSKY